ncbi:MAG: DUF1801 domain-containing protein [Candidatus Limnocylindria bacterium]
MVTSTASTPDEYVAALPEDRRAAVSAVRDVVNANLPEGYREGMQFGMIAWYVPLERFSDTYNKQPLGLAALASQKHHMSLYLNNVYGDRRTEAWFRQRWAETGKTLDMGKSCVRFKRADDLPLEVIGETIARADLTGFLRFYTDARGSSRKTRGGTSV